MPDEPTNANKPKPNADPTEVQEPSNTRQPSQPTPRQSPETTTKQGARDIDEPEKDVDAE